jgi:predicted DNA-binding protein
MIRTQVQLTEDQARRLKELASRRGVSMAELIREGIERVITDDHVEERWKRASAFVSTYRSGRHDVSRRHDDYLVDDFR